MTVLKRIANRLGLPFGEPKITYNSRLAQELSKWAESKGKGHEFRRALFHAYFVKEQPINEIQVLAKLAESVDLNFKDAQKILQERSFMEAVDLDWKRSCEANITEIPTFILNHQVLVGAQPYETLKNLLLPNDIETRNPNSSVPRYDETLFSTC
jgi:predicted DsbA family dithiol-disulfide isomerase